MEREESYRLCPACDDSNCLAVKRCGCCDSYLCDGCWTEHYEARNMHRDRLSFAVLAIGLSAYAVLGTLLVVLAIAR